MEFSKKDNLLWTVRDEAIQTVSGIPITDRKAIVREDTRTVLSVMGKDYTSYQNSEMFEMLERISNQTGLEMKKCGLFGNGEKVFVQLKSGDLKLGNDRVEGYLTGINSFDGSSSYAFGPTNVTISCTNTFFAAFRDMSSKVRHTKNMVLKIDDICRGFEGLLDEEKKMFASIKKMSEYQLTNKLKDKVTRELFNVKKEFDLKKDFEKIATVTQNRLSRFSVDLNGELSEKGNNVWGLFSGVTKYTTHSLTNHDNSEAKMFGTYGIRERGIFQELSTLVN